MLSRLPRELLEELVVLRKRYIFAYVDSKLEVWSNGDRTVVIFDVVSASKEINGNIFLKTSSLLVQIGVTQDTVSIWNHPSEIRIPLNECCMDSFHRAIGAIPLMERYGSMGATGSSGYLGE